MGTHPLIGQEPSSTVPPRGDGEQPPRSLAGIRLRFGLLLVDSLATLLVFFAAIAARFLAGDGILSVWACRGIQATGFVLFLGLCWLPVSPRPPGRASRLRSLLANATAYLGIAIWIPDRLASLTPKKGSSALWLALEWWKLPSNLWLFLRVSPVESALLVCGFLAALYHLVARKKPFPLVAGCAFLVLLLGWKTATMGSGVRVVLYWLVFLTPLAALAILAFTEWLRPLARLGLMGLGSAVLLLFYSGLTPLTVPGSGEPVEKEGIRRVYPPEGVASDIPLEYLRKFSLDPSTRTLFSSFGPTSGVFRLRLETGEMNVIETLGVVRTIWADPASNRVLAPDWLDTEFLVLRKDPFAVVDKVDIRDSLVYAPLAFQASSDRVYLLSTDLPGLTEYSRPGFKKLRQISFRELGLTRFRSGAWDCALDVASGWLFAEIGMVDLSGDYLLLRVNLGTFEVERTTRLPEGGSEILLLPAQRSVLVMSFFSDRIYEVDETTLEVRRVLHGPLTTRAAAYDARRDLLYLIGFARGDLWVLRHSDGVVLKRTRVGKKALSIALDDAADRLVVGGTEGILEIDLARFLGEKGG